MADTAFFAKPTPISVGDIAALTGAATEAGADLSLMIDGAVGLDNAGPHDISFADNSRYLEQAATTRAGACLCSQRNVGALVSSTIALIVPSPQRAFTQVLERLYPSALRPGPLIAEGIAATAVIAPTAVLEDGVTVEAGAVIGPGAEIGRGTVIGPLAVIGPGVKIGRNCSIGPGCSVLFALIGDRVILHPGVRVGQDGFGYIPSRERHTKIPQIGRVVIQDDVEIGAGTAIDRGAVRDTIIGEGTKIDNLCQIAHNATIGRGCLLAGQVGVAGSATLGDGVVVGGQTGINGHIVVGAGAQIGGASAVHRDVPPGQKWAGSPARPLQEWLRARSKEMRGDRPLHTADKGRREPAATGGEGE